MSRNERSHTTQLRSCMLQLTPNTAKIKKKKKKRARLSEPYIKGKGKLGPYLWEDSELLLPTLEPRTQNKGAKDAERLRPRRGEAPC